jgi:hypothetical protein
MSDISRYTFEDSNGYEIAAETSNGREAMEIARRNGWRVIDNVYTFSESLPVYEWDFTSAESEE